MRNIPTNLTDAQIRWVFVTMYSDAKDAARTARAYAKHDIDAPACNLEIAQRSYDVAHALSAHPAARGYLLPGA